MDFESLFSAASTLVLPGWLLLILAPRWRWTTSLITSCLLPGILAAGYLALVVANFGRDGAGFSDFNSLSGVKSLFQNDALLLAGWIHYLAFDLFVGSWEVRDARAQAIPHWLVVPCLVFTFMLGPVGLLMYLLLRLAMRGRWTIESSPRDAAKSRLGAEPA
jgi:hypothetical protein